MALAWNEQPKTLEEVEAIPGEILTCANVAAVLGASPNTVHLTAVQQPALLGFPVIVMGSRVKIPKRPFLRFMRGEREPEQAAEDAG